MSASVKSFATAAITILILVIAWTVIANRRAPETKTSQSASTIRTKEFSSGAIEIDKIYRSMTGPVDEKFITLGEPDEQEPIWIKGIDVEPLVAREDDDFQLMEDGQHFICHVNFSHPDRGDWQRQLFERQKEGRWLPFNWFTLVQGHYSIDFPEGFGVPSTTNQKYKIFSMAQNQDPDQDPFRLRIRSRFKYIYARDLMEPLIPLSKFSWDIRVPQPFFDEHGKEIAHDGESCAASDEELIEGGDNVHPAHKASSSGAVLHFAVPPGRHSYRGTVQGTTKIPFDTTAHHISAHLHVYGESLELIDKSTGTSLFKSEATANDKHTGIAKMTHFSSTDGVPIYRNHEYELVATYNNTTDKHIDAMAVVYIYYKDVAPAAPVTRTDS